MKLKKTFLLTLIYLLIIGCSKDQSDLTDNETPNLLLSLVETNSYSGNFNYNYSSNIQKAKLIWNENNEVNIDNKTGEINLTTNDSNITINNLKQNKTYFFRLTGELNNEIYYSNVISASTSDINLLLDKQVNYDVLNIFKIDIIKKDNGFLIATEIPTNQFGNDVAINIIKLDKSLNSNWSFIINESLDDHDNLAGIITQNDNTYIGVGKKYYYDNTIGLWGNAAYSFKFDDNGNILSKSNISTKKMDLGRGPFSDSPISFKNNNNQLSLIVTSDSTYYGAQDVFFKEIKLNNNGESISETSIGSFYDNEFGYIKYDTQGNKYNYGSIDSTPNDGLTTYDAMLSKLDLNNNFIWKKAYGNNGSDDRADDILIEENQTITIIGNNGHENGFDDESRWIINTDIEGNIIWDFKETRENFLYQGKDITKDSDGNYLALFFDIYYPNSHVYNIATLIKLDKEGNIIWKYADGEDFNDDGFEPKQVFNTGENEYTIFGIKNGKIWVKKIRLE